MCFDRRESFSEVKRSDNDGAKSFIEVKITCIDWHKSCVGFTYRIMREPNSFVECHMPILC